MDLNEVKVTSGSILDGDPNTDEIPREHLDLVNLTIYFNTG
jgi:hypothetical protein